MLRNRATGAQAHRVMADAPHAVHEAVVEREPERMSVHRSARRVL